MPITEIHYGLDPTALLEGPDWGDIDEEASVAAYRASLKERLEQAFPAATVEICELPRARSWAHPDNRAPSDSPHWFELARRIDEELFQDTDAWLVAA